MTSTDSGPRVPDFDLPHISGAQVSRTDYRGRDIILVFGGRKTASDVERLVETIRARHTAEQLPIIQIATLKGVPRIVHGLAKKDMRNGYQKQVERETARLREQGRPVPEDLSRSVIMLLDWEGIVVGALGIKGLERAQVALLVDGEGHVRGTATGPQAGEQVLGMLTPTTTP
jgi:hypothetical protein